MVLPREDVRATRPTRSGTGVSLLRAHSFGESAASRRRRSAGMGFVRILVGAGFGREILGNLGYVGVVGVVRGHTLFRIYKTC